mmetsp:Transcript_60561/g.169152  ORF Transcript_60561/g.169152 Transcript_60561/m.169152 type:complete len:845 (+) Transcript_60561:92-2626(+)
MVGWSNLEGCRTKQHEEEQKPESDDTPLNMWSRRLEAVEAKQAELHDMQWKAVKDQMATLHLEHELMNEKHGTHFTIHQKMTSKVEDLEQNMTHMRSSHEQVHKEIQCSTENKMTRLELCLAEIENAFREEVKSRNASMAELKDHLSRVEKHTEDRCTSIEQVAKRERDERLAADDDVSKQLTLRCGELEQLIRKETREEHAARDACVLELRELFSGESHARHEHQSYVNDVLVKEKGRREAHEVRIDARLVRHTDAYQNLLEEQQGRYAKEQATTQDRVDSIEAFLQQSAEGNGLGSLKDLLAQLETGLRSEISKEASARKADVHQLRDFFNAAHTNSFKEFSDGEKCAREAHEQKVHNTLASHEQVILDHVDAHNTLLKEHQTKLSDRFNSMHERFETIESFLPESAEDANRGTLKDVLSMASEELRIAMRGEISKEAAAWHAEIVKEAGARETDIEMLREYLAGDQHTLQEQQSFVKDHLASEKMAREAHEERIRGYVSNQENKIREHHGKLSEHQSAILERIECVEAFLHESAGNHDGGTLKDHLRKIEQGLLHKMAVQAEAVDGHFTKEKEARDQQQNSLRKLATGIKTLEQLIQSESLKHLTYVQNALSQERTESRKSHTQLGDRISAHVEAMEAMSASVRGEFAELKVETKHLWEAMDSHTHDKSPNLNKTPAADGVPVSPHRPASPLSNRSASNRFNFGRLDTPIEPLVVQTVPGQSPQAVKSTLHLASPTQQSRTWMPTKTPRSIVGSHSSPRIAGVGAVPNGAASLPMAILSPGVPAKSASSSPTSAALQEPATTRRSASPPTSQKTIIVEPITPAAAALASQTGGPARYELLR